jgi:tetratricopeptide (TPR) repeat protein
MGTYLARGYTLLVWSMEEEWPDLVKALGEQELSILDSIRGNDAIFRKALEDLGERSLFARALRDFDRAESLCPHSDDVFSARAYALQNFPGQERKALEYYQRAAELNPHNASAFVEHAEFLISNPHLMIDPKDLPANDEGLDGAALGELIATTFPAVSKQLEENLTKALKIEESAHAYFLRGSLRGSALQEYRGAIDDLTAAIRLEPLDPSYYEARASVHEAFGHDEKAQGDRSRIDDLETLD